MRAGLKGCAPSSAPAWGCCAWTRRTGPPSARFPEGQRKAREPHVLVLTKANSRSTVYQPKYLDYIGVKKFDDQGRVVGEHRFLGLYTREAEASPISQIPILSRKQDELLSRAGFAPDSYDGREAIELLADFPAKSCSRCQWRKSRRSSWACCGSGNASAPGSSSAATPTAGTCPA